MRVCVATHSFRHLGMDQALATIPTSVAVEISTCAGHLSSENIDKLPPIKHHIAAMSGGWCDFVRGSVPPWTHTQARVCAKRGMRLRLFLTNPKDEAPNTESNIDSGLRTLYMFAAAHPSTTICIENHGGMTARPHMMQHIVSMLRSHGCTNIYTTLDIGNYYLCGVSLPEIFSMLDFRTVGHVHAKDYTDGDWCALGDGVLSGVWAHVIDRLRFYNYGGYVSLECEGKTTDSNRQMEKGIQFLSNMGVL